MGRFQNSWGLLKSSWEVLKAEKELTAIPIVSTICSVLVALVMGAGVFFSLNRDVAVTRTTSTGRTMVETQAFAPTPLTYVVGILGYIVLAFVVTFFTAALVSGAYTRLRGGDATLGGAFSDASKRLPQILLWSLVNATVGLILRSIRERFGFVGAIIASAIGMAWEIVTWLAIPIIVVEGTGPIQSLKKSAGLFKKTWGENLIAQAGFGLAGLALIMPGFIIGAGLVLVFWPVGVLFLIVYFAAVSTILSTLSGIYRTALYMYATTGEAPSYYSRDQMQAAFRPKTGAGRFLR